MLFAAKTLGKVHCRVEEFTISSYVYPVRRSIGFNVLIQIDKLINMTSVAAINSLSTLSSFGCGGVAISSSGALFTVKVTVD